jgi:hypothetical protein
MNEDGSYQITNNHNRNSNMEEMEWAPVFTGNLMQ